jgi:hypothetical protein
MLLRPNPAQVVLQVLAVDLDGTPKLDVAGAAVRVYHVVGGGEVEVLPLTDLAQVGASSTWRLVWLPPALPVAQYVAEYQLVDANGVLCVVVEDVTVHDLALQADLALVRQVETGRWRILGDQMIFYGTDDVTPILTFDLKDQAGLPTMENVFERVPA